MFTEGMRVLARIMVPSGLKALTAWRTREFTVGQTTSRKGESRDFASGVDQPLDGEVMRLMSEEFGIKRFLTEEGKDFPDRNSIGGTRIVQDIIDGSSNFITGEPDWSLSVAIEGYGGVQLGGIFCSARGELLVAERGHGTYFLNTYGLTLAQIRNKVSLGQLKRITVLEYVLPQKRLDLPPLRRARLYTHTGRLRNYELDPKDPWNTLPSKLANPGCTFCCTAALVKVALGKLDGAAIGWQNRWDFAAGGLLITEAGGYFTVVDRDDPRRVLTPHDLSQAYAGNNADGKEWQCHVFAAGAKDVRDAVVAHFQQ